jgi:hypothetical protein
MYSTPTVHHIHIAGFKAVFIYHGVAGYLVVDFFDFLIGSLRPQSSCVNSVCLQFNCITLGGLNCPVSLHELVIKRGILVMDHNY